MSTVRALVVEDSMAVFDLIHNYVEKTLGETVALNHTVTVASAAKLISENDYAVIIHNLFLPPWGPESVASTYKAARGVPIIVISGHPSPNLHRTAIANGARMFCSKGDLGKGHFGSIFTQVLPNIGGESGNNGK